MDEELRELLRKVAQGDTEAQHLLRLQRLRAGLCPTHGLPAAGYDPITKMPDPAGWGTGCPACETVIYCITGRCGLETCHKCFPVIHCDYGHEVCLRMEQDLPRLVEEEEIVEYPVYFEGDEFEDLYDHADDYEDDMGWIYRPPRLDPDPDDYSDYPPDDIYPF